MFTKILKENFWYFHSSNGGFNMSLMLIVDPKILAIPF